MSEDISDDMTFSEWLENWGKDTPHYFTVDYTEKELKKLSSIDAKIRFLKLEEIGYKQLIYEHGITKRMVKENTPQHFAWLKWCKEEIKRLELAKPDQQAAENEPESLIPLKPEASESKKLSIDLNLYGFYELKQVKEFTEKENLLDLLHENDLPYQIAMFDNLGFFDHLLKNHCKTKDHLFGLLSKILNVRHRTVKGNFHVLDPFSKEDRKRYTAHNFKEAVKKDLQKLK